MSDNQDVKRKLRRLVTNLGESKFLNLGTPVTAEALLLGAAVTLAAQVPVAATASQSVELGKLKPGFATAWNVTQVAQASDLTARKEQVQGKASKPQVQGKASKQQRQQ